MILKTPQDTADAGSSLASLLRPGDVVTLSGPRGVGKTEWARAVLAALGHVGDVPSPTFAIVQPYEELELPVWHVDLYRIEDPAELAELGLDSATDDVLLVEWPERAGERAWPEALRLALDFAPDGARCLTAEVPPSWQSRWPQR
jgi:tRNA threonylcarbamoyladenosine biosynthesis protein TsaE